MRHSRRRAGGVLVDLSRGLHRCSSARAVTLPPPAPSCGADRSATRRGGLQPAPSGASGAPKDPFNTQDFNPASRTTPGYARLAWDLSPQPAFRGRCATPRAGPDRPPAGPARLDLALPLGSSSICRLSAARPRHQASLANTTSSGAASHSGTPARRPLAGHPAGRAGECDRDR